MKMIVNQPGKVTERITLLGSDESTIYHVDGGDEAVLIGGGMVHIIPLVMAQIEQFGIDEKKIGRILVLHSHFDHCGIVDYLKKEWPWITVAASRPAEAMLVKDKVVESIRLMNRMLISKYNAGAVLEEMGVGEFLGIAVETVLDDGRELACGDLTLEIIAAPGHSPCSIAVYIPQEKALFASDAAGIAVGDDICVAANSDFDQYQQSLEKMAERDVAVQLAEHYGARTGEDGKLYLSKSIKAAQDFRGSIEDSLERTGDPVASSEEIAELTMKMGQLAFLPRGVVSLISSQMVNFVDKKRRNG